ncbi:MAG: hypothetical protein ACP5LN_09930 [Thermoproteota archaeon]|jgi:hypothetical protein
MDEKTIMVIDAVASLIAICLGMVLIILLLNPWSYAVLPDNFQTIFSLLLSAFLFFVGFLFLANINEQKLLKLR